MSIADKWLFRSNLIFFFIAWFLIPDEMSDQSRYEIFFKFTLYDAVWVTKAKAPFFKIATYTGFQVLNLIWAFYYLIRTPTWLKGSKAFKQPNLGQIIFLGFTFAICSLFYPAISLCH